MMTSLHPDDSVFFLVFHSKQVWHSSNYTSTHRNNNICTNTPTHIHTHAGTRTHIQFKCAHKSTSFTVYICIFILFRTITNTFPHIFIPCTQTNTHMYILCTNTCTHIKHTYILTHTRKSNGPMQKAHTLGYHTFIFLIYPKQCSRHHTFPQSCKVRTHTLIHPCTQSRKHTHTLIHPCTQSRKHTHTHWHRYIYTYIHTHTHTIQMCPWKRKIYIYIFFLSE